MEKLKETVTYRVQTDAEAEQLIEKNKDGDYTLDTSIKNKNRKQKGEIIDEWLEVTLTKKYN